MLHMLLLRSSIMVLFFFPVTVRKPSVKPIITAQNKFTTPLWYMNMDNTEVYTFSHDGVQWKIIHKYICTFLRTIKTHSHSCSKLFNIFIIIVFNSSVIIGKKCLSYPVTGRNIDYYILHMNQKNSSTKTTLSYFAYCSTNS